MRRSTLYTVLLVGLPVPVGAQTPEAIESGRKIFHGEGNCFQCHGGDLEGGPVAPALATGQFKDAKGGTLDAIVGVITNGVPGTAMVSHPGGITDAEVQAVAAYVWAVSHKKAKP